MTVGEELQIEIIEVAISMLLIVSRNIVFFPSILLAAQLTMQNPSPAVCCSINSR